MTASSGLSKNAEGVLLQLAREPASLPKITFDMRITSAEAAEALQELRQFGLVEEASTAPAKGIASQESRSPSPVNYLSQRGLEVAKRIMSRSAL